jgi:hypothetical protein
MPKSSRRAGQNIHQLAAKRRVQSIISFTSAGFILCFPFFLVKLFQDFLRQLPHSSQSQVTLNMPPSFYAFFTVAALGLVANGVFLWKRANHAVQGAKGEENVAEKMVQLEQAGWKIEYGMRLGNRLGDADIVCISPQDKAFVIDVKSHRGEVISNGKELCRRMGKTVYPFEKNFLEQAMKQALQVKQQKNLRFVTPIVAFSEARVLVPSGKVQKVYVVEKSKLVSLLKSLG